MAKEVIRYGITFDIDEKKLKSLRTELQEIQRLTVQDVVAHTNNNYSQAKKSLNDVQRTAGTIEDALKKAFNPKLNTTNIDKFNMTLKASGQNLENIRQEFLQIGPKGALAFAKIESQLFKVTEKTRQAHSLLNRMGTTLGNSLKWTISSSIINNFTGSIQQAWGFTKSLDRSLNGIRVVTGKSADEMARFAEVANTASKNLGATTTDYTNASLIYFQQGLKDEEVKARTETTLKVANITGQSADQVSEQLTSVWNGYKVSAEEAELYIDRLAAVAANSASDLQELSVGMSKVAAAAATLGVGEDQLAAQLSTIISVTRQAPESIGVALKTVYARISDIKAGVEEDGVSLGQYSQKMADVGISVLDSTGKLRNMGTVMEEIGSKWGTLTKEQQVYLAQTMAGQRQYSNLIALFDNFDKYENSLQIAQGAAGTIQEQQETYLDSIDAHLNKLAASGEGVWMSLVDSDSTKKLIDVFAQLANGAKGFIDTLGGGGNVLLSLGAIAMTVFRKQMSESLQKTIYNFSQSRNEAKQYEAALKQVETNIINNKKATQSYNRELKELKKKQDQINESKKTVSNNIYQAEQVKQALKNPRNEGGQFRELTEEERRRKEAAKKYLEDQAPKELDRLEFQKTEVQDAQQDYQWRLEQNKIREEYLNREKEILQLQKNSSGINQEQIQKLQEINNKIRQQKILEQAALQERASTDKNLRGIKLNGEEIKLEDGATPSDAFLNSVGGKETDTYANKVQKALQTQKEALQTQKNELNKALNELTKSQSGQKGSQTDGFKKLHAKVQKINEQLRNPTSGAKGIVSKQDLDRAEKLEETLKKLSESKKALNTEEGSNLTKQAEQLIAILGKAQGQVGAIQQQLPNLTESERAVGDIQANIQSLEEEFQGVKSSTSFSELADQATQLATGIAQVTAASAQLANIGNIWRNDSLSTGQKILSTTVALTSAVGAYWSQIKKGIKIKKDWNTTTKQQEKNQKNAANSSKLHTVAIQGQDVAQKKATISAASLMAALGPIVAIASVVIGVISAINSFFADQAEAEEQAAKRKTAARLEQANATLEALDKEKNFVQEVKKLNQQYEQGKISRAELKDSIESLGQQYEIEATKVNTLANAYGKLNDKIKQQEIYNAQINAEALKQKAQASEQTLYQDENWENLSSQVRQYNDKKKSEAGENKDTSLFLAEDMSDLHKLEQENSSYAEFRRKQLIPVLSSKVGEIYKTYLEAEKEEFKENFLKTDIQVSSLNDYTSLRNKMVNQNKGSYLDETEAKSAFDNFMKTYNKEIYNKYNTIVQLQERGLGKSFSENFLKDLDENQLEQLFELSPTTIKDTQTVAEIVKNLKKQGPVVLFSQSEITAAASETKKIQDLITKIKSGKSISKEEFEKLNLPTEIKDKFTLGLDGYKLTEDAFDTLRTLEQRSVQGETQLYISAVTRREQALRRQNLFNNEETNKEYTAVINKAQEGFKNKEKSPEYFKNVLKVLSISDYATTAVGQAELKRWKTIVDNNEIITDQLQNDINDAYQKNTFNWTKENIAEDVNKATKEIKESGSVLQQAFFPTDSDIKESDIFKMGEVIRTVAEDSQDLSSNLITNNDLIQEFAKEILRYDSAVKNASKSLSTWKNDLQEGSAGSLTEIKNVYQDTLNLFGDNTLSANFLRENNNLELLEQALIGVGDEATNAYNKLAQLARADIISNITNKQGEDISDKIRSAATGLTEMAKDYKAGSVIEDESVKTIVSMIINALADAGKNEDQIRSVFKLMNITVPLGFSLNEGGKKVVSLLEDGKITVSAKAEDKQEWLSSENREKAKDKARAKQKSKYKEQTKFLKEQRDIYHDINRQLEHEQLLMKRLQKQQKGLYGSELIKNLNKQEELLNQQNKSLQVKQQIQEKDLKQRQQALASKGATFDSEGNLSNYMSILGYKQNDVNNWIAQERAIQRAMRGLDSSSDYYKDLDLQLSRVQFEKKLRQDELNDLKTDISDYEKIQKESESAADEIADLIRQKVELNLQKVDTLIKIKLDLVDITKQWEDFKREVLEKDDVFNPNAFKSMEKDSRQIFANMKATADAIPQSLSNLSLVMSELKNFEADENYQSKYFNNQGEALEKLKEYMKTTQDLASSMSEYQDQIKQLILKQFDEIKTVLDKQNQVFEFVGNQLQHNLSLIDLAFGEEDYEAKGNNYEQIHQNNLKRIDLLKVEKSFWEEQRDKALTEGNQALADQCEEKLKTVIESLSSLIEESLQEIKDQYENTLNNINKKLENMLTNGHGFDYMELEWSKLKEASDLYFDSVEAAFAIKNTQYLYQQALNDTQGLKSQQQLKKVMNEQLQILKQKDKLTKYDVDRASKILEIEKARIALEEARNNKTQMRLKRDSQGNYSYQFTANQEQIDKAQNELLKAQNDLYTFDKQAYKQNMDTMISIFKDASAEIQEIYTDNNLSVQQQRERAKIVYENMQEKMSVAAEQNISIRKNLADSAFESYNNSVDGIEYKYSDIMDAISSLTDSGTQHIIDQWINNPNSVQQEVENAINSMEEANKEFGESIKEVCEKSGVSLEDVRTGELDPTVLSLQGMNTQVSTLMNYINTLVSNSNSWTTKLRQYTNEWKAIDKSTGDALREAMRYYNYITSDQFKKATYEFNKQAGGGTTPIVSTGPELIAKDVGGVIKGISGVFSSSATSSTNKKDTTTNRINLDELKKERLKKEEQYKIDAARYQQQQKGKYNANVTNSTKKIPIKQEQTLKNYKETLKEQKEKDLNSVLFHAKETLGVTSLGKPGRIYYRSGRMGVSDAQLKVFYDTIKNLSKYPMADEKKNKIFQTVIEEMKKYAYPNEVKYFESDIEKHKQMINQWEKQLRQALFDTGGYTGAWHSSQGKLAILHEKELVLNKEDTANMLKMLEVSREMLDLVQSNVLSTLNSQTQKLTTSKQDFLQTMNNYTKQTSNDQTQVDQQVKIEAVFPAVNSRQEIEEAFSNLTNLAVQRALKFNKN